MNHVLIIGSGISGMACAVRCAERGVHVTLRLVSIDGADHRFKNKGELEKVISAAMRFWNERAARN